MGHRIATDELPSTPDEIDLDRIVADPQYRNAVKALLRVWQPDAAERGDAAREKRPH